MDEEPDDGAEWDDCVFCGEHIDDCECDSTDDQVEGL